MKTPSPPDNPQRRTLKKRAGADRKGISRFGDIISYCWAQMYEGRIRYDALL